jgi:hypothetical protein
MLRGEESTRRSTMRNYQLARQQRIQSQNLEVKAKVDGIYAGIFTLWSLIECRKSEPDDIWCATLRDMAEKKSKDFLVSSAAYAVHTLL